MERSLNFAFLARYEPRLEQIAAHAERDWSRDPAATLTRLRTYSELLAQSAAAAVQLPVGRLSNFSDVLELLERRGLAPEVVELFHQLRKRGNDAAHRYQGTAQEALAQLRTAHELTAWYVRARYDRACVVPPFATPPDPDAALRSLAEKTAQLERSHSALASAEGAARAAAEAAEKKAREAEELAARKAREAEALARERDLFEALARENEARAQQAQAPPDVAALVENFLRDGRAAAKKIRWDEAATRALLDAQLREAGWEADSSALTHAAGARPEAGRNQAIAEWPTASGRADYALFVGELLLGVVEAKASALDVPGALEQARRYSKGLEATPGAALPGAPWRGYFVPFLFAANGRPYVRQLESKSGVWFQDVRRSTSHPRALQSWYSPEGLRELYRQDLERAERELARKPLSALGLRGYQTEAIAAVEAALAEGKTRCLLAMATGTGKTRTAIGLLYRLLEAGRFRRVLFVVDRSALGEQALNAFKDSKVEHEKTFAQIFGIKELGDVSVDRDTRLHVVTVQSLLRRVLDGEAPTIDTYDCVLVDECHRGYTLDRELSDAEREYRDESDYLSKYRRAIEYFDAVRIGLTATPALHTTELFGHPVFSYGYARAVVDKVLVPQEPVYRIETRLNTQGIHYGVGETVTTYNKSSSAVELSETPDELDFTVEDFNRAVVAPEFTRVVCEAVARELDPSLEDKTLVFCVDDAHATEVTAALERALDAAWGGVEDGVVRKITGSVDRPLELVRRFRNERHPSVVVTVDLLTTGIDVPRICNLVFLRRVKSRILYEQMLGRATRLCPEIEKESFRVFDAVGQAELMRERTEMVATVVRTSTSFEQLAQALLQPQEASVREHLQERFVEKLRRKRSRLSTAQREALEALAGEPATALLERLQKGSPEALGGWLVAHPGAVQLLDAPSGVVPPVVLHSGEDSLLGVRQEFEGRGPADYLADFERFVREQMNLVPALLVLATRPRELTRKQLHEVAQLLGDAGFDEARLRAATRQSKSVDVAASLVGFVRQGALGDPLVPYEQRVRRALERVLARRQWTLPQRKWLERIAKQLERTTVVDRGALDEEPFRGMGGHPHLDQVFEGHVDDVLASLQAAVWEDAG